MPLELPDVTLVAQFGVCHDLTLMAVDDCCRHVKFGDVLLFTDRDVGRAAVRAGPFTDFVEAGRFSTYEIPSHIKTSHALFIHWDSWVVDPGAWQDEFLRCDYIGAPWWYSDGYNVGNSGFCIRSKRLLDFLASHEEEFPLKMPEDDTLCRRYRRRLEPQFKWASEGLAHRFAFERVRRAPRSFGFHGVFNFVHVLELGALKQRVEMVVADPHAQSRPELTELKRQIGWRLT